MTAYASPRAIDAAMSPTNNKVQSPSPSTTTKTINPVDDNDQQQQQHKQLVANNKSDFDEEETAALLDLSKRLSIMASLLEQARNANRLAIEEIRQQVCFLFDFDFDFVDFV